MDAYELDVFRNVVAGAPAYSHRSDKPMMAPTVGSELSVNNSPIMTVTHVRFQFLTAPDGSVLERCIVTVS